MILTNYIKTNRQAFIEKMKEISYDLGIPANWLMAVMYKESSLNHEAVNRSTGAAGLIQFMPATAAALGTTTQELISMTNVDQLEYVKKYYWPLRYKVKSYTDTYLAVFFPAAMAKPADYVLKTKYLPADTIARQNSGLDFDKNSEITKAEVEAWALSGFIDEIKTLLKKKE